MFKSSKLVFIFLATIISLSVVSAACPIKVNSKTTSDLLNELPSINTDLQTCPTAVPSQLTKLIKNGVLLVEITDNDDIAVTIKKGMVTSVQKMNGGS